MDEISLINNIYVCAVTESVDNQVSTTSHPTESGMPLSDSVRKQPISISLQGKIVDTEKMTAETAIEKIKALMKSGSMIKYVGQAGTFTSMQIESFKTDYTNKTYGGADFDMTLKEIRTAKSAYVKTESVVVKTKTLAEGDTVTFKGGYVYVASDSLKPSAKRGRSTCKLTKISKHSWSTHKYHLISKDGRLVYGWVDVDDVVTTTVIYSTSSDGGTQQLQESYSSEGHGVIYHTIKKGDTLYNLVNVTYKDKNLSIDQIIQDNPHAFANGYDAKTMRVGHRLEMAY